MKRREFLAGAAMLAGTIARSRATDIPAPAPDKLQRITAFFENEVTTGRLSGATVLIQQHGKPVYFKMFGVRDVRTRLSMTPDTIFAIHSMTKPITSLAAMMLIDEGKVALTDPVSKYIPLFAGTKVGLEVTKPDGGSSSPTRPPTSSRAGSTTRNSPSASQNCRWRASRARCGATVIPPTCSAASSKSSPGRRCTTP